MMSEETMVDPESQSTEAPDDPATVKPSAIDPGTADADYAFAPVDGIDKGLSDSFDADFIKYAKEAGLDKEAASKLRAGMLGAVNEQGKARIAEIKAYDEKCAAEIKGMFGDQYDGRMNAISKFIEKADGVPNGEFRKFFSGTKLMNEPTFIKFMDLVVRVMPSETPVFSAKTKTASADDLKGDIARLMAEKAYLDAGHPEHTATVEKVYSLRRQLFGEV